MRKVTQCIRYLRGQRMIKSRFHWTDFIRKLGCPYHNSAHTVDKCTAKRHRKRKNLNNKQRRKRVGTTYQSCFKRPITAEIDVSDILPVFRHPTTISMTNDITVVVKRQKLERSASTGSTCKCQIKNCTPTIQ